MIDRGVVLQEPHALDVHRDLIAGSEHDVRVNRQADGGAAAHERDPPVHDDEIRLQGDVHFRGALGHEHVVVSVENGTIGQMCKTDGELDTLDGVSIDYGNWRFNVRMSNTEPLIRLNVESKGDIDLMKQKTEEILELIRS